MPESELEKAYRRRQKRLLQACGLGTIALAGTIAIFGRAAIPAYFLGVFLLGIAMTLGDRIFFNHAWRQFDALQIDPLLDAEGRELAKAMGVRLRGVKTFRAAAPGPWFEWRGLTLVATTNVRDLPPGERRFALAFWLALRPTVIDIVFRGIKRRGDRANLRAVEAAGDLASAVAFWTRMEALGATASPRNREAILALSSASSFSSRENEEG